jgi:hypothetical protein
MIKQEAVTDFIESIDKGNFRAIIVRDNNGDFYCQPYGQTFKGDEVVYSYGGFVNSSANLDVEDISRRI